MTSELGALVRAQRERNSSASSVERQANDLAEQPEGALVILDGGVTVDRDDASGGASRLAIGCDAGDRPLGEVCGESMPGAHRPVDLGAQTRFVGQAGGRVANHGPARCPERPDSGGESRPVLGCGIEFAGYREDLHGKRVPVLIPSGLAGDRSPHNA